MLRARPLSGRTHRRIKRPDLHRQGSPVSNIEIGGHGGPTYNGVDLYAWWAFFTPMAVRPSCCQIGHAANDALLASVDRNPVVLAYYVVEVTSCNIRGAIYVLQPVLQSMWSNLSGAIKVVQSTHFII